MGKKLIELKGIHKEYNGNVILDNFNLYINENEFVTLVGPSGCGKTTTLRMIGGFEDPDFGEIILDGMVINNTPAHQRPINTVFQRYALFPHLNVYDNVAFGLRNFSRVMSDLKTKEARKFEAEREELSIKLQSKNISKEEKAEIKYRLKEIKSTIKANTIEAKNALIEKNLDDVEAKYGPIIEKLDEQIDKQEELVEAIKADLPKD
jgi:spermidine/putrescine transport system ATP-binding protein